MNSIDPGVRKIIKLTHEVNLDLFKDYMPKVYALENCRTMTNAFLSDYNMNMYKMLKSTENRLYSGSARKLVEFYPVQIERNKMTCVPLYFMSLTKAESLEGVKVHDMKVPLNVSITMDTLDVAGVEGCGRVLDFWNNLPSEEVDPTSVLSYNVVKCEQPVTVCLRSLGLQGETVQEAVENGIRVFYYRDGVARLFGIDNIRTIYVNDEGYYDLPMREIKPGGNCDITDWKGVVRKRQEFIKPIMFNNVMRDIKPVEKVEFHTLRLVVNRISSFMIQRNIEILKCVRGFESLALIDGSKKHVMRVSFSPATHAVHEEQIQDVYVSIMPYYHDDGLPVKVAHVPITEIRHDLHRGNIRSVGGSIVTIDQAVSSRRFPNRLRELFKQYQPHEMGGGGDCFFHCMNLMEYKDTIVMESAKMVQSLGITEAGWNSLEGDMYAHIAWQLYGRGSIIFDIDQDVIYKIGNGDDLTKLALSSLHYQLIK